MVFSLGDMPLANRLLGHPTDDFERFPLDLWACESCTLAQLGSVVPPKKMFTGYPYLSSYSPELVKAAKAITSRMELLLGLTGKSLAAEIGSNDGYLLQFYKDKGIPVLGVDPSEEARKIAAGKGITTLAQYFTPELAQFIVKEKGKADVIHANNVMAHVPDINGFAQGIKTLLAPEGEAVIEVGYAGNLTFDQIYHEHCCYFTKKALCELFARNGLCVRVIDVIPAQGGSLRAFVCHDDRSLKSSELIDWKAFRCRSEKIKNTLIDLFGELDEENVVGFGAAAKATILMNYVGETGITYIVDDNPLKQDKWIPGTCCPINSPEFMKTSKPDYLFLFSWNYAEQIMERFPEFEGKFIIPFPSVRIV